MPDTKLSALTTQPESALANGDLFYFVQIAGPTSFAMTAKELLGDGTNILRWYDGANTLAQRSGANAQTERIYNTYTSSTNGEWFEVSWAANLCTIGTNHGSLAGSARTLNVQGASALSGSGGNGANVILTPGAKDGAGTAGIVQIKDPASSNFANFSCTANVLTISAGDSIYLDSKVRINQGMFMLLLGSVNAFATSNTATTASFGWNIGASGYLAAASDAQIGWCSTAFGGNFSSVTNDTGLKRIAAKVIGATDGSTGNGWLQNTAGRARTTSAPTNATATMSNLTDLSLSVLAGRKYTGRLVLFCKNSTASEGFQVDFNGGSATVTSVQFGIATAPGATIGTATSQAIGTAVTLTAMGSTNDLVLTIEFEIVVNAAGTLIPRFAEVSHTTGTATVEIGSSFWLEDSPN